MLTFGVAWLVATAQNTMLDRLQSAAPKIKGWGGALLLIVGTWLLVLGIFAEGFAVIFPV